MASSYVVAGQNKNIESPTLMRVLWTHNFDPAVATSGVFMHTAANGIRALGVDLHLEYLGNLRSVSQMLRARKRVRSMAPSFDVIHAQYGSACAIVTAAADAVPKVLSVRGSDWQVYRSPAGFLSVHSRIATFLTRTSIKRYACIASVSKRMSGDILKLSPDSRVEFIPSPIDLSRFIPRDKKELRSAMGFPDSDEKWVLFNSRHLNNPVKRYALAQRAFDLARQRDSRLRFRLATEMPHEAMPEFVAACDVILCTSENEGWPNSIKEALACNVPFVATDVGDLQDIAGIEPSCRICPADANVLADNLCDVIEQKRTPSLRRHVEEMGLAEISAKTIAIYQSLLDD